MTEFFDSTLGHLMLLAIALVSLQLIVKMLLQPLLSRLRVLKHMEDDGARQAVLQERARNLQACIDLIEDLERTRSENAFAQQVLIAAHRLLQADRCALARGKKVLCGPGDPGSPEEEALDKVLRGAALSDEPAGVAPSLLLAASVPSEDLRYRAKLIVARSSGRVPFASEAQHALASLAEVVGLGLALQQERAERARERGQREEAEEGLRRARVTLSRTQQLGLQGELSHHLVRELTAPLTGMLGLAQFLDQSGGTGNRDEIRLLLDEALRCRRILEQFAAVSISDAGQESLEIVNVTHVIEEVLATTGSRFRAKGVRQTSRLPTASVLLTTNPTTITRLVSDVLLACLDFAEEGRGEVCLALDQIDEVIHIDLIATRGDASCPEQIPDPPLEGRSEDELWKNVDTIPLAIVHGMCRCLGGRLRATQSDDLLHVRLLLATGRAAIPLHAGLLPSYGADSTSRFEDRIEATEA